MLTSTSLMCMTWNCLQRGNMSACAVSMLMMSHAQRWVHAAVLAVACRGFAPAPQAISSWQQAAAASSSGEPPASAGPAALPALNIHGQEQPPGAGSSSDAGLVSRDAGAAGLQADTPATPFAEWSSVGRPKKAEARPSSARDMMTMPADSRAQSHADSQHSSGDSTTSSIMGQSPTPARLLGLLPHLTDCF